MKYFNLHTHRYSGKSDIIELVNQYPQEFESNIPQYSIGIHPLFIDETRLESDFEVIHYKLVLKECLAVGECGLDKRSPTSMAIQQSVFERQLDLAEAYKKPVVIHWVADFNELIAIKKRQKISVPIVVHGFSKKASVAEALVKNDFYLSFGKNLLRNPELELVFRAVPNNYFFLETDTIEEGIEQVYELAAKYKKINSSELEEIVNSNYKAVFESD